MALLKRVLIAIIFIPLIIILFTIGGVPLASFLALIVFQMIFELREIFRNKGTFLPRFILILALLVFFSSIYFTPIILFAALMLSILIIITIDIFRDNLENALARSSAALFSIFYTAVLFSSLYHIRLLNNGKNLIFGLLITIWVTDTAAYFIGNHFGKHKGIFRASPNKSLEGFIAGIIAAFAVMYLFIYFFDLTIYQALAVAISGGIFGQLGDLFESILKRDAGIKDSSDFLPGHGGLLDRFDSILFAAPVYFIILYLIQ
ncbi:MAG: phosphatidate cytidylyltransferase [Candidatus Cloacimonetes bacterium]|nr:phosphatidate cytidylyltransferase [Candidatus Cloacimonadota bacterium]